MVATQIKKSEWAPRFWEGIDFFAWLRLLWQNRFAVEWPYIYIAVIVCAKSFLNTCLRWMQERTYADRIRLAEVAPPIFVLGHWRTGTTLLHELMIRDPALTCPTSMHCFEPCHFLITEQFYSKYLRFLLPDKRPMDNMPTGWDRPQEDEFALVLLGEPSPYTDVAFPNHPSLHPGSLNLSGLTAKQVKRWQRTLGRFVRFLSVRDSRPLVMKSPPHTARIPELLQIFPEARFVHITRDPNILFASTVNLWLSLGRKHGFQTPCRRDLIEAKVFREFRIMMERYLATRALIPANRLVEIRYDDLVKDIVGVMTSVYEKLQLPGVETVIPYWQEYVTANRDYETNRWTLTQGDRDRIHKEWGDLISKLGY